MNRALFLFATLSFLAACARTVPIPSSPDSAPQANVPERTNVGNGGSDVLRKFVNLAEDLLHAMEKSEPVRDYLARRNVDVARLKSRWSPDKVYVVRESIRDHRGSAVDARESTGRIELYEPVWERRFAQGNDQKEMTLHEVFRLYTEPGQRALDDDYQLSRDVLSILRMSEVSYTTTGDDPQWYNSELVLGDRGCQATMVQGHLDSEKKVLYLSFARFLLDTRLWVLLEQSLRPSFFFNTYCELKLRFVDPVPGPLYAGAHISVFQPHPQVSVGVKMHTERATLAYQRTTSTHGVAFSKDRIGEEVREIDFLFGIDTVPDFLGQFSIEKATIPFYTRDKK